MRRQVLLLLFSLFAIVGFAQQRTVTGTVVSAEDGLPVIGASVHVKGTSQGATTDLDGKYSIKVNENASLTFSYVGMQPKTVQVGNQSVINVTLTSSSTQLDEVVVTAMGIREEKKKLNFAVQSLNADEVTAGQSANFVNSLQGKIAGVQVSGSGGSPNSSSQIIIRAISSINSGQNNEPLFIIDGMPMRGGGSSAGDINPNDIESIDILKDAASAALYGARGAAGVIIITTKSGKNRDAEITVDAKWGANTRAVQDYDVITDPGEYYEAYYAQFANYGAANGLSGDQLNTWANNIMLKNLGYNIYTVPDGQQLIGTDGKLNPNATLGRTFTRNGKNYYMTNDDWNDVAYNTAMRQEYTLTARGASDRASFYTSLGYLKDDGVIDASSYERISARIKADYQAKSWLKLGVNAQYLHSKQESSPNLDASMSSGNLMYYTAMIAPIYPVYVRMMGDDGKPYIATDQYGHKMYDYGTLTGPYGITRGFSQSGNPLGSNMYNKNEQGLNQINGTFTADVTFTPWLKLNVTSNVVYSMLDQMIYTNSFEGPSAAEGGRLEKSNTAYLRTNNTQTLTFMKSFGLHNVDALIGHEYYYTNNNYLGAKARAEFSPYIQQIDAYANKYDASSYLKKYNVEGFFGRAQYNYNNRYFASLSYRRDASSYFAKNHRWGSFWSVGGAWIVSKEKWFNAPFVDELKLKASIGQQGNDNIGSFAYTDLYNLTPASSTVVSPSFYRIGNEDITWETTTNFNAGVEFSLFKGRLTGALDVYTKKTSDLLFWLSVPESNGSRGYYGNLGDIRNTGVELSLTGAIVRTKDIDWSVTANFSHNSTKVLKLPESKIADNGGFAEANPARNFRYWYREGGPLYNAFMPKYAGVNENGEALYWKDTELNEANPGTKPGKNLSETTTNYDEATYYEQGSLLPKLYGGFSTSFRYKAFDVNMVFDYQLGGKVFDQAYAELMANAANGGSASYGKAIHKDWTKSWSADNLNSNLPRWQYGDQYQCARSDRFLTSARYLNFQSFSLGYTLPKGLIPQVSKVRIYCMGENLCFWSARKGLDPRYSYDGSGYTGVYSPTRNISGGIQVTF